ncbi:MAG: DEAD/DEAH box helicase [Verrucomicrobia bacterium]|nr:DEAD/DEAH box helicase [Verrucomicrobiota bacterium]
MIPCQTLQSQIDSYLDLAQNNGLVKQVGITGRDVAGWEFSELGRERFADASQASRKPETSEAPAVVPRAIPAPVVNATDPVASILYPWQRNALDAWEAAGCSGITEAVTGTGKTVVGAGAIERTRARAKGTQTLVVVPTIVLMNQWHKKLSAFFPGRRICRYGGGVHEDFSKGSLVIAVVNSVYGQICDFMAHCERGGFPSLLIADECHHYLDAPEFSRLFDFAFSHRMGLSATVNSRNAGKLGGKCFCYDFKQAHADGLVPSFKIINVAVPLTYEERGSYDRLSEAIGDQLEFVNRFYKDELTEVEDSDLLRWISERLRREGAESHPALAKLMGLIFKRASILCLAESKMVLSAELVRLFVNHRMKVMVFFERIASLTDLRSEALSRLERIKEPAHYWCETFHSKLDDEERTEVLKDFEARKGGALLACRSLDEGLDIPTIDAAVLAASSQSSRQRIQRIGRALRRDGEKEPVIVTLYAERTRDTNVIRDDRRNFDGVAEIFDADSRNCISLLTRLLEAIPRKT